MNMCVLYAYARPLLHFGCMQLQLVLLVPQFTQMFGELWAADGAYARQCLLHYMEALAGPPNRPTDDPSGKPFVHDALAFEHNHKHNQSL